MANVEVNDIKESLLGFVFPQVCAACRKRVINGECICFECELSLPKTNFHKYLENKVDQRFWGRVDIEYATSLYYFSKSSRVSQILHDLKYRKNKEVGVFLGKLLAKELQNYKEFQNIDCIVPVPISKHKLPQRGYNQCTLLAQGFAEINPMPIEEEVLVREVQNKSQTKLGRWFRWVNVKDAFVLKDKQKLKGKNILVIDDVITTGGTIEAVANELLKIEDAKIYVASIACVET